MTRTSTALSSSPLSPSYGVFSEFQVFALLLVKSLSESDSESTSFKNRRIIEDLVDETTDHVDITAEAKDVISMDDAGDMPVPVYRDSPSHGDQSVAFDEYEIRFYVCALF